MDRDGVLNVDRVDYVYRLEDLIIQDGVIEGLQLLKENGFLLVVITNQSGIAKGIYTADEVWMCHNHLQSKCGNIIDALYFCPHHPDFTTQTLTRKPDSLMIERAAAKFKVDMSRSWMVGDANRDIAAGKKAGVRTIQIIPHDESQADKIARSLFEAAQLIVNEQ